MSLALWGSLCAFFSLLVSSGAVLLGAFILALLFGIIAVMLGPQVIAAGWLIGSPTVFGFPNEVLRILPFVTMERLAFAVLAVIVFLQHAFSKRQTRWLPLETAIVIFLVYALINMALHTNTYTLRRDGWLWIQYLLPMAGFIVSRRIAWSDRGLRILLATLTLTGVFLAVSGILQTLLGIDVFTMNYQSIAPGHVGRAYGTFSNAHTYVATLFIFLALSLLQYSIYEDAFMRFYLLSAMGVIAIGIILGATRAPWIGAALAFAVIFAKHPRARPAMTAGGFLLLLLGIAAFFLYIDHLGGLMQRITNITTLQGRAATWATALNMIADNPLFGAGFRATTFTLYKPEYITGIGSLTAEYALDLGIPHNEYLHVAVLTGVIGLLLFLLILLRLLRLMFQVFEDPRQSELRRLLALYVAAIVIALMFNSFFSDTYVQDYFWALTYFLAGIAAGNLEPSSAPADAVLPGDRRHESARH